jgi:hypothetical protein
MSCWSVQRKIMSPLKLVLLAGLAFNTCGLRGENAWLKPERFKATPGATLRFQIVTAEGFFADETIPIAAPNYGVKVRLGQDLIAAALVDKDRDQARFSVTLIRPGHAAIAGELEPIFLEKSAEEIEARLREVHAGEALREAWGRQAPETPWREHVMRYVKIFVRVGEPSVATADWSQALGAPLEIIPEQDPTKLRAGDRLSVRALREGAPLPNFALDFKTADDSRDHVMFTDLAGRAEITLDAAGLWLIYGTDLRLAQKPQKDETWVSTFASLALEVN